MNNSGVQVGAERADVLANTTSVGMEPHSQDTPVPAAALANFRVVFDAVYTPLETRLLKVPLPPSPATQGLRTIPFCLKMVHTHKS